MMANDLTSFAILFLNDSVNDSAQTQGKAIHWISQPQAPNFNF